MLVNRLSLLLTERQLAIKRVVADTHISRNTISNISNNPTANVSTATINRLCQYFSIQPADFFEFVPFDFQYSLDIDTFNPHYFEGTHQLDFLSADITLYISIFENQEKINTVEFSGSIENYGSIQSSANGDEITQIGVVLSPKDRDETDKLSPFIEQSSPSLLTTIKKQIGFLIENQTLNEYPDATLVSQKIKFK